MSRITRIYLLRDPRTREIRYVGKTVKKLRVRLSCHMHCAKTRNTYRDRWIMSLATVGLRPLIEQIDSAGSDWASRERFWIAHFRELGCRLVNLTDGGEGVPGHVHSAAWRAEQSLRTAAAMTPERRAAHGRSMRLVAREPGWKEHHRQIMLARMTPEMRRHLSETTKASMTAERLAEMSRITKSLMTPERRAAQSAKLKATTARPEWRAADPEAAARYLAALKAGWTPERRAKAAVCAREQHARRSCA